MKSKKTSFEEPHIHAVWLFKCYDKAGNLKWIDGFENLVVNEGMTLILEEYFNGAAYTAAHYVGLKDTGAPAAGDTMGAHATWTELVNYTEATRPAYSPAAAATQSIDNSASKAAFSINAADDVYGAFLSTDNTKSGVAGSLISAGDFAAARSVVSGDTLNITITYGLS